MKLRLTRLIWLGLCILTAVLISAMPISAVNRSILSPILSSIDSSLASSKALFQIALLRPKQEPLPTTVRDPAAYGSGISRTLRMLSSSTPVSANTVRILFYGQSITGQDWWLELVQRLRAQFPDAHLVVENRAIGGFASPLLVRTAEQDLYPFYPDLVIFHVYGDEQNYEAIIANLRRRTTAEIVLASDHVTWLPSFSAADDPEQLRVYEWFNQHTAWLETIAQQYGCELVDIRTAWEQHLKAQRLSPQDLLRDQVHLNAEGNHLMATLMASHLLHPAAAQNSQIDQRVSDYPGSELNWQQGHLSLEFTGNRVALVATPLPADLIHSSTILIDGQPPSQFPELYALTRASSAPGVGWPSLLQIRSASPLLLEDWQLTIRQVSAKMDQFQFDLSGSQTGFDGSGDSQHPFISNSQRILIQPQDWWLEQSYLFTQQPVPLGFQIRWRVEPLFTDLYRSPAIPTRTGASIDLLAQNLSNGQHRLEIISKSGEAIPIETIRVYHPLP
ncbi:MAG: hypothetical protein KME07_04945 [Pegethrix bostrychoides GSE-TBD4-15B]|jgi:hypothetical protein|uniref:SGNH hydrolase-type esterase domain-containing protein n=1 Tax=Pegethrix bostrychoides GSE-TBD4-15B TaxID=2839662 RepID=A0A951U3L7_9CYAN|nr:hypothetical protein [Pegethrix bostrychoides GSE-TBD4-15B]